MQLFSDVLLRAQAFSLFDVGADHDEFVLTVNKESRRLVNIIRIQDERDFVDQISSLTELLNDRSMHYGHPVSSSIADFMLTMRKNEETLEHMLEINTRSLALKENVESKFGYILNAETERATKLEKIEKDIRELDKHVSSLGRNLFQLNKNIYGMDEEPHKLVKATKMVEVSTIQETIKLKDDPQDERLVQLFKLKSRSHVASQPRKPREVINVSKQSEDLRVQNIIDTVADDRAGLTLNDITEITKVPKNTVMQICNKLVSQEIFRKIPNGKGNANVYVMT